MDLLILTTLFVFILLVLCVCIMYKIDKLGSVLDSAYTQICRNYNEINSVRTIVDQLDKKEELIATHMPPAPFAPLDQYPPDYDNCSWVNGPGAPDATLDNEDRAKAPFSEPVDPELLKQAVIKAANDFNERMAKALPQKKRGRQPGVKMGPYKKKGAVVELKSLQVEP